ncbi:leucine-rich repeat domain-containing protein [Spirochaeta cellobiosiphila]|uniref:leucine-rich repeat domain-containing protein n=1 Tax=Spirochaeta cellobiosiphila TaxID=504483 RepID=UPI0004102434|nr:hypothetical protein [Spirochaeta cellobiosiphila]
MKFDNIQKALSKIKSAKTTLSLNQMWLGSVPEEVGELQNLSRLDLSYNDLKELPDFVYSLTKLRHLKLKGNKINFLSEQISQLTKLKTLDLEGTVITALPESIGSLSNLEELIVESGALTKVPDSLGSLTKLKVLDLGRNPVKRIPESIGQCTQLERLNLTYTQLESLPSSLGQLQNLEQLSLLYTNLTSIPDCLGDLTCLTGFGIAGMEKCVSFPSDFSKLTRLKNFILKDCKLDKIPQGIYTFSSLDFLRIEGCGLTAIPEDVLNLSDLKGLYVGFNKINTIPEFLSQKEWLTLDLSGNNITASSFPDNFEQMKIHNLYLYSTPLSDLKKEPDGFTKPDMTKIAGIGFKIQKKRPDTFVIDLEKSLKEEGSDLNSLKTEVLNKINQPLIKWGGTSNQITEISDWQCLSLKTLIDKKLSKLKTIAKRSFQEFYGDDKKRILMDVQSLELPQFDSEWEITINNKDMTGPLVILKMNGWNVSEETLVG